MKVADYGKMLQKQSRSKTMMLRVQKRHVLKMIKELYQSFERTTILNGEQNSFKGGEMIFGTFWIGMCFGKRQMNSIGCSKIVSRDTLDLA